MVICTWSYAHAQHCACRNSRLKKLMIELKEKVAARKPGYDYDEFHEVVGPSIIIMSDVKSLYHTVFRVARLHIETRYRPPTAANCKLLPPSSTFFLKHLLLSV